MSDERQAAPIVDLHAIAAQVGVDLAGAFTSLDALYADIDARNAKNTAGLELPCHRGCSACCHESVFLTPLEFLRVWDHVQRTFSDAERDAVVRRGLELYEEQRALIEALEGPTPEGEDDHFSIAAQIRFRCPFLSADEACTVYPARELYARLFGCSFNAQGGVYGCLLVGQHLGGRTVTLVRVPGAVQRLVELPLTFKRQVFPYYVWWLYGPGSEVWEGRGIR